LRSESDSQQANVECPSPVFHKCSGVKDPFGYLGSSKIQKCNQAQNRERGKCQWPETKEFTQWTVRQRNSNHQYKDHRKE